MTSARAIAICVCGFMALATAFALGLGFNRIRQAYRIKSVPAAASVPCPLPDRPNTAVIVTFGQSNAANFGAFDGQDPILGDIRYRVRGDVIVLNWRTGTCSRANDPLPGADGIGASIWSRFGDALIEKSLAKHVVLVPFAQGATRISDWVDGQREPVSGEVLGTRIEKAASALKKLGVSADFVAFQQGESDRTTEYESYRRRLGLLAQRVEASFGLKPTVGISTLCQTPPAVQIARAIRDSAAAGEIVLGPDFDGQVIHALDRVDRCHFSLQGLEKAVDLWLMSFVSR